MTLIKHLILFSLLLLLFSSCEDNKKATVEKPRETNTKPSIDLKEDTFSIKNSENKTIPEEDIHQKITSENMIELLTEYSSNNPETKVRISTVYGNIDVQLYKDTPLHRASFIYLVKHNYFDESFFHRIVPNFIIQGGNSDNRITPKKRAKIGKDYLLPYENVSGRKHRYGSISGAKEYRKNPDNKTFPFEFFIFLGPLKHTGHLNGKYTIFGQVTKGMNIVEKIAKLPADNGDWPLDNVYISVEIKD